MITNGSSRTRSPPSFAYRSQAPDLPSAMKHITGQASHLIFSLSLAMTILPLLPERHHMAGWPVNDSLRRLGFDSADSPFTIAS
jgi:hypothetical protein